MATNWTEVKVSDSHPMIMLLTFKITSTHIKWPINRMSESFRNTSWMDQRNRNYHQQPTPVEALIVNCHFSCWNFAPSPTLCQPYAGGLKSFIWCSSCEHGSTYSNSGCICTSISHRTRTIASEIFSIKKSSTSAYSTVQDPNSGMYTKGLTRNGLRIEHL